MPKLTKRTVEALAPKTASYFVWDSEVTGFGVRVMPSGAKSYQVQYRKGGRTRRASIGRHGAVTVDQARRHARELLGDVAAGRNPVEEIARHRRAPTVAALCDRFFEDHARGRCKPSTQAEYRRNLDLFIKPGIGTLKVVDVERRDIADLHHGLRHIPYQANRMLQVLSKMFNLAEVWGLRPDGSNPCRHVPKFPEKKRERFLRHAELERLGAVLSAAETDGRETPHVAAAFRLLMLTGCRLGEIQTLKWDHVTAFGLELPDSKTGARLVPLPDVARELLDRLPRLPDNPFVIIGDKPGQHITDLQRPWRRLRAAAGLDDVRIHDLRHTYAAHAASSGVPLAIIGRILGHTQYQTTMRYAHLADAPVREAANQNAGAIGELLGRPDGTRPRLRVVS